MSEAVLIHMQKDALDLLLIPTFSVSNRKMAMKLNTKQNLASGCQWIMLVILAT
jgi:hypothetical protein